MCVAPRRRQRSSASATLGCGHARERRLDQPEPAPVGQQARDLVEVRAGIGVARPASDEHDRGLGRVEVPQRLARPVLGDGEHGGVDAEVAAHPERDARVAHACARQRGGAVVLEVSGGEQHERDRDDVGVAARDELVDAGVDQRLGELDEPEPDRQIGRRLADVLGERPELLEPVGVAAAVADDQQRRAAMRHHRHDPGQGAADAGARAAHASGARRARGRARASGRRSRARASRRGRARRARTCARRARRPCGRCHGPATASAGRRRAGRARAASAAARRARPAGSAARSRRSRSACAARAAARRRAGCRPRGSSRRARRWRALRASPWPGSRTPATAHPRRRTAARHEEHERRLDHEPAGQQRERRAGGGRDRGEQRRVDEIWPNHMTTRDERHGHDEQHRGQHLALGGRAVQRRLDRRLDFLVVRRAAHSRLPRPWRRAGRITVEKYGAAPSGAVSVWPGAAELLAVDGAGPLADRASTRGRWRPPL